MSRREQKTLSFIFYFLEAAHKNFNDIFLFVHLKGLVGIFIIEFPDFRP